MAWNFRMRPKLGPFHLNISKRGIRSVSFTIGDYTKNLRTGRSSFDTPGPGSIQWGGKRSTKRPSAEPMGCFAALGQILRFISLMVVVLGAVAAVLFAVFYIYGG